jgi:uracil-DNA glycosylase
MEAVELILLIGQYVQKYYLGKSVKKNLTETVWNFGEYLPQYFYYRIPLRETEFGLKKR